ncbi:hypothetical protein K227x_28850 [Rubripirellula lacrimiformis]|uniref:SMP-30/Gluconolaconase/LRE-like region n=1 Tax=Rubripirellula lacrimiformis TaxID=1930273 RepID=A0A517NBI6_9BACT|nr:hypothetical protein [Rubripirellula lacrimiformis]QDT04493.1 hypothetical protein K227x_28850 [Rubripirellula lacrimiformis]
MNHPTTALSTLILLACAGLATCNAQTPTTSGDNDTGKKVSVPTIASQSAADKLGGRVLDVQCSGTYPRHLQGICSDETAIYWSFTTTLVKTDMDGNVIRKIPVVDHHGDLCMHDGRLYVAVNLGKFNDPAGNADSWVYVYDAADLTELEKHEVQQVFHGAGGIGYRDGQFYVVGGLPDAVNQNYVYQYDPKFQFVKKHVVESGHTHLGIQAATFANDRWWFGCYGNPAILLVTDANFQMVGRYENVGSLGIEGLADGRLLIANGKTSKSHECTGGCRTALPDAKSGFQIQVAPNQE